MDNQLQELGKSARICTRCNLSRSRTNVVFGNGNPDSRILLVGEAPGFNEDKKGIPFCGKAGEVLDRLLASVGLSRDSVYVTNILKCRPPDNRDPLPEEIAACRSWLDRQMDLIRPAAVCCLGRFSLYFMLEKYSFPTDVNISRVHGKVFEREGDLFGKPPSIVALYHPAVATYNVGMFPVLKKDFEILKTF